MIFNETKLEGAYLIDLEKYGDERGFFARSFCQKEFEAEGLPTDMVQTNVSFSKIKGTLRGMHYQRAPYGEDKLVRCSRGAIYDVIVDLRPDSPTYMEWVGAELSEDNQRMMLVRKGLAHGFITLTEDVEVTYQVSQFYTPEAEGGLRYDDPALGIEWPGEVNVLSDKDRSWPYIADREAPELA